LTAKQHLDVQALEKLSSKGKKAKQRRIIVKTVQNVKDKANELTEGTYFEQPVDPSEGHFCSWRYFATF
jgi:hypothetical protein